MESTTHLRWRQPTQALQWAWLAVLLLWKPGQVRRSTRVGS
jgi:hypothetical protein